MSKKKNAGSNLPTDFTPSNGWNYGMDGFDFDMDYGDGVLDRARLPEARGLSQLPDGLVSDPKVGEADDIPVGICRSEHEGIGDLSELMKEGSLAGLGWLHGEQDPARLPKNPVNRGIAELEQAWGVDRRTDGIVPNVDKAVADYEAALRGEKPEKQAAQDELDRVVFRAHRRSAYGDPIQDILKEAAETLGHDFHLVEDDLRQVKDEHGLAGNVFIYAAAFPGLHNGKWKKTLRRKCAAVRYVIAEEGSPLGDVLKMEVVDEVPWKKAYRLYAPRLQSAGFKVASEGDPKEILRLAFLSIPKNLSPKQAQRTKPVDVRPADTISHADARKVFAEAEPTEQEIVDLAGRQAASVRKKAHHQIIRWLEAGLLNRKEARRLVASEADPRDVLKIGVALIQRTATSDYEGTGLGVLDTPNISEDAAWKRLATAEDKVAEKTAAVEAGRVKQAKVKIQKWADAGLIPERDAQVLLATEDSAEELLKGASEIISENKELVKIRSKKAKQYDGAAYEGVSQKSESFTGFTGEDARIIQAAKTSGFRAGEIKGMLRWARKQMSEGMAGTDLTQILKLRFTKGLRTATKDLLAEARKQYEGVSGHLYVDAAAYATPTGLEGCEDGAKRHRTNDLQFVMSMSQCAACTCNSRGTCTKYGKQLMDELPAEDKAAYQREMIRQAEASDAELTANLFAPTHDPQEFSLTLASDNLSINEEAPDYEDLGDVFFGGIEIE